MHKNIRNGEIEKKVKWSKWRINQNRETWLNFYFKSKIFHI